ncbi:MAG: PKD domain-containing protein [Armatimonadetes bacterium]|nr:PKD domain-containing protein [Armatimonadota bacterium]
MTKTKSRWLLGMGVTFLIGSGIGWAQQGGGLILYRGDRAADTGLSLGGWGSGKAEESTENVQLGTRSLKITTQGLYQGGRIALSQPIDISSGLSNPSLYLRVSVKSKGQGTVGAGPGGMMGGMGAGGGMMGGMRPGGGMPGMGGGAGGGAGMPGMGGAAAGTRSSRSSRSSRSNRRTGAGGGMMGGGMGGGMGRLAGQKDEYAATKMRIVLVSDTGKMVELTAPIPKPTTDSEGFVNVNLPLAGFKGDKEADFRLKDIVIAADVPDTLYIGEISSITDTSPITGSTGGDQFVARGDTVEFAANVEGGAAILKYSWDFDDKDGLQEESTARNPTHAYKEAGDYVATLTVTDTSGVKQPLVVKTKVHVEE